MLTSDAGPRPKPKKEEIASLERAINDGSVRLEDIDFKQGTLAGYTPDVDETGRVRLFSVSDRRRGKAAELEAGVNTQAVCAWRRQSFTFAKTT